jgi:hypothetical protein
VSNVIVDPQVIAAWSTLLAARQRVRRAAKAILLLSAAGLVAAALTKGLGLLGLTVVVGVVSGAAYLWSGWHLVCPSCRLLPVTSVALADIESATSCPHCNHALTNRRDGDQRVTS